ncbi:MAG: LLM class flavin-dependent oxidoreductase [Nitrospinota bacterium]
MKFSFFMMPCHQPREHPTLAFERDISLIEFTDALDFDEFFIGEHHSGGWETMPAPEMALAKASATAHRIRLGTSVIGLPYHHPFHVAERMAFLDHLTRGRAILGIGPSNLVTDKKLFQVPPDRAHDMMTESVDIIVRLLESEEPIDYEGRFWSLRGMRLQFPSYQKPRMPLAIATSGSRKGLELAGKYDMILMSMAGKNRGQNPSHAEQWTIVERAAADNGVHTSRENWRMATSVYVAETREEAWADVEEGIMRETEYFWTIGVRPQYEEYPGQPFGEVTARSAADRRGWIVGTPDDAIAAIERMQEETGGFGGLMLTTHEWTSPEKIRRSLELFARHVIPHFKGFTRVFHDEWRRIKEQVAGGGVPLNTGGLPSNLDSGERPPAGKS